MSEFSFEKYMAEAIKTEQGDLEAVLPVRAHSTAADNSAEDLEREAFVIGRALSSVKVPYEGSVVRRLPLGMIESVGWNLTELAPIGPAGRVLKMRQDWLALTGEGELYRCVPLAPDTHSYDGLLLLSPNADLAQAPYLPERGTVLNNETIRFGLARLVARYEIELPRE
jgi:hypothetical protein